MIEDEIEQEIDGDTATYYIEEAHIEPMAEVEEIIKNEPVEKSDQIDKKLLADFLTQHAIQEGPSKFTCNLCQNDFKNMKWLETHMKTIHSNWIKANCKKQPTCQICGKSFRGPGMLKMHMKTHERENKMPTCSVCGKEFKSKSILYRHRASHFADQKHVCTICNKTFNSNYQLNAHTARHQKTDEPYQCVDCEKCYNTANDLKVR